MHVIPGRSAFGVISARAHEAFDEFITLMQDESVKTLISRTDNGKMTRVPLTGRSVGI